MKVLFYGRLADALGRELEVQPSDDLTIGELRTRIVAEHPQAAEALSNRRVRACIGNSFVADDQLIAPGDKVEFLPPVSGG